MKEQLSLSDVKINLADIESFQGGDKSWHLVFHHKTELSQKSVLKPSDEVDAIEWFALDKLPDKKEFAHNGWALYTIDEIVNQ
ncbi:MAG: hypothetical protein M3R36_05515 [Bacteroidota bacterium]|nr:hypothetical protein [Bacteroidota bacterium]